MIAPGYLLTWHTYGTWLHGDAAGSVDECNNAYGSPRLDADPVRFDDERAAMVHRPLVLSPIAWKLVDKVMREHCGIRSWDLRALAVRSNHVHVVIGAPTIAPEPIMKQLKEWGTRRLRSHRIIGAKQLAWADHGRTIYLSEPGSLEKAIEYVLEAQDAPREEYLRPDWRERLGI